MALTKSDIVASIHDLGLTKKKSVEVIESLLEIIKRSLESSEDVLISGFGKFCVKEKSKRKGPEPCHRRGFDAQRPTRRHLQVFRQAKKQNRRCGVFRIDL